MADTKLTPYLLKIEKHGDPVDLSTLPSGGMTGLMKSLFDKLSDPTAKPTDTRDFKRIGDMDSRPEKTYTAEAYRSISGKAFEGELKVGYSGIRAGLLDTESVSRDKERTPIDSEEYPFYVSLILTKETGIALIFVRKYQNKGIKQDFVSYLQKLLDQKGSGEYAVTAEPYTTDRMIERIDEGKVRKIRVSRLRSDLSNIDAATDSDDSVKQVKELGELISEYEVGVDLRIVPSGNYQQIKDLTKDLLERLKDGDVDEDSQANIWCSTEYEGAKETFSLLKKDGQPVVSFDDDVVTVSGGHPKREEMWEALSGYLNSEDEYLSLLGNVPDLTDGQFTHV